MNEWHCLFWIALGFTLILSAESISRLITGVIFP